ncbi:MAG: hypothetical protein M1820_002493 [Bogoriella megaspora]|nr:MAG: hypothetical protein M1820_002493 [Bogoriella megaspora]
MHKFKDKLFRRHAEDEPAKPKPIANGSRGDTATSKKDSQNPSSVVDSDKSLSDWLAQVRLQPSASDDLSIARAALYHAMVKLQTVLQKKRIPTEFIPEYHKVLQDTGRPAEVPPFTEFVKAMKSSQEEKEKSISHHVGKFMAATYPATKFALGLIGNAASLAGVAPAQITANGLSQVLEIAMEPGRQTQEALSGLDLVVQDQDLLNKLRMLPEGGLDQSIIMQIVKQQTSLTEFLRESIVWLEHNRAAKLGSATFGIQDLKGAKSELEQSRRTLREMLSDQMFLNAIWNDLKGRNKEKLNAICEDDEHYNHLVRQSQLSGERLENSGTGILLDESYPLWRSGEKCTLWCPGLAGAGKTYCASAIIDDLQLKALDQEIGLAFYYCQFDRRNRQSELNFSGAIIRQLAARKSSLCNQLKIESKVVNLDQRKSLLLQSIAAFQSVYLVIDALDEWSSNLQHRFNLVKLLTELRERAGPKRLRLCITSRGADDIYRALAPAIMVPIRASRAEIEQYVDWKFRNTEQGRYLIDQDQDQDLLGKVKARIIETSDRIFKLASLQVEHAISASSPIQARKILDRGLKTDIDGYYKLAFDRMWEVPKNDLSIVLKLLTWIFYSLDRMTMPQLSIALGIGEDSAPTEDEPDGPAASQWAVNNIDRYISLSQGLLIMRSERFQIHDSEVERELGKVSFDTNVVIFAHETVDSYLRTNLPQNPNLLLPTGNSMILEGCIDAHLQTKLSWFGDALDSRETMADAAARENILIPEDDNPKLKLIPEDDRKAKAKGAHGAFLGWAASWGNYVDPALSENPESIHKIDKMLDTISARCGPGRWKGWSPLIYCVYHGFAGACRILLSRKEIDPNAFKLGHRSFPQYSAEPEVPIWFAMRYPPQETQSDTIKALLECPRLDPNFQRRPGWTPLHWAVKCYGDYPIEVIQHFLDRDDIAINHQDDDGWPVIFSAANNGLFEHLDRLLSYQGVDTNIKSKDKSNVLMVTVYNMDPAARRRDLETHKKVVQRIIDHDNFDINAQDKRGDTALHNAASGFLEPGNKDRLEVDDILRCALQTGPFHTFCVNAIVSSGRADVKIADKHGYTALDDAIQFRNMAQKARAMVEQRCLEDTGEDISRNSDSISASDYDKVDKHLVEQVDASHGELNTYLKKNAGDKIPFVLSFYFWNSGSLLQVSKKGLIRPLLYQAFSECSDLAAPAFAALYEEKLQSNTEPIGVEFSSLELVSALRTVVSNFSRRRATLIIIDGLDEFEGKPQDIISTMRHLTAPNTKSCVSSRPWNAFNDVFGQGPYIRLQYLNSADIESFVMQNLKRALRTTSNS